MWIAVSVVTAVSIVASILLASRRESPDPAADEEAAKPTPPQADPPTPSALHMAPSADRPAPPKDVEEAFVRRIRAALSRGDFEGGMAIFDEAAAAQPDNRIWPFDKALLLGKRGDHVRAIAAYRKAIQVDPTYLDAWVNLGMHLDDSAEYEDALEAYDHALTLDGGPRDGVLLSNRANTLMNLERFEDALESVEAALAVKPDSVALRTRQTALGFLGRAEACNAARPKGSPFDRGPFYQLSSTLPDGRNLVIRFWAGRHSNPEMLESTAVSLLEWLETRADVPPGLEDGVKIPFGFSVLTLRERGNDVVVCEPYFAESDPHLLNWSVGFTLQTVVMQSVTLSMVQPMQSVACSMLDVIAIDDAVFEERTALLHRVPPVERDGFSGWMIGVPSSFAQGAPDPKRFVPMQAARLVARRHALIKALQFEPGVTVRMEDHIITSVVDADGRERLGDTPPPSNDRAETVFLPSLSIGLHVSADRDALVPGHKTETVFLPPGSDPMKDVEGIRNAAADWLEFVQILQSAPGIPGSGVPLHYHIAWPENEPPHPHLAAPPEVFDEADAKARIRAHCADPREPDDEALIVVPNVDGTFVWARRWDANHFSSLEDFMMQVAFVKRRRKAVDFFGSLRSHHEMSPDWGLPMLQHIERGPFCPAGSVLRGAVLVDLETDFIQFGSMEWFGAYTEGFMATRFVFGDEKHGRELRKRLLD